MIGSVAEWTSWWADQGMYHTAFFLREILELKENKNQAGRGIGGKVKKMKGFFAVKQAPSPPAAQVLARSKAVVADVFGES